MKIDLAKIKEITQESVKRAAELEVARKVEEEKLRLEAELQEKERQKFQASVKKKIAALKKDAVLEALNGNYQIIINVDLEHAVELKNRFSPLHFVCKINKEMGHTKTLTNMDRINAISALCSDEINEVLSFSNQIAEYIKNIALSYIKQIEKESANFQLSHRENEVFAWDQTDEDGENIHDVECVYAMQMINKRVDNLIKACLSLNAKFDPDSLKQNIQLIVNWKSKSWESGIMDSLLNPYTLNWLSSGAGQGFIDNLKTCIENAASQGNSSLELDFVSLGIKEVRWGLNEAFKALDNDKPIGVLPFRVSMLKDVFTYLGFQLSLEVCEENKTRLHIGW